MLDNTGKDSLFEAMFRQAVIEIYEEELEELSASTGVHTFSELHNAKMKKLFRKASRQEKLTTAVKWVQRSAAVIVLAFIMLLGTIFVSPQAKAAVEEFMMSFFDTHVKFDTNSPVPIEELEDLVPDYIPDGFVEVDRLDFAGMLELTYANSSNEKICISRMGATGSYSADNENHTYYTINEGGMTYHIFEDEDVREISMVIWTVGDSLFSIEATLEIDEILRIVKSIN